jgi:hypothetical protein
LKKAPKNFFESGAWAGATLVPNPLQQIKDSSILAWRRGTTVAPAHAPDSKSFFASFCAQKEGASFAMLFAN